MLDNGHRGDRRGVYKGVLFAGFLLLMGVLGAVPAAAQQRPEDWAGADYDITESTKLGDFLLIQSTDPITDETQKLVFARSLDREPARLAWRCMLDEALALWTMNVPVYLGSDRFVRVVWRVDKATPFEDKWDSGTTGREIVNINPQNANFTELLLPADTVVIRLFDPDARPHTYKFGLAGLTRALAWLGCTEGPGSGDGGTGTHLGQPSRA